MVNIEIPVRYGREITERDCQSHETNLGYGALNWTLPIDETALVLVDCWGDFPLGSFVERAGEACKTKIRPVLEACRDLGVAVIHAPSPAWAANYPDFQYRPQPDAGTADQSETVDWPPDGFTAEAGDFFVPRAGAEPVYSEWWKAHYPDNLKISSYVEPAGDDLVISTGDELHAICCERHIKHLVYAGFATNICVLYRDYGVMAMKKRGYNIIFIRDATTAVESSETVDGLWAMRSAIFYIEIKVGVTVTTDGFLHACRAQGG